MILSLVLPACNDGGSTGVDDPPDTEAAPTLDATVMADAATGARDAASSHRDAGPGLIEGRPCPPDNTTTYANTGAAVLISWCITCHSSHVPANQRQGAPWGVDFDTVEGIREYLPRIYARAGDDNDTMPPVDSVSAEERRRLGDWITCGAPGLESAMLPDPGDGGLAPDGGAVGGRPGRGPDGRDGGMMSRRDAGSGPPGMEGCMEDADCEAECARTSLGCTCVERPNGVRPCVRNCEEDADCPGNALVCRGELCQRG